MNEIENGYRTLDLKPGASIKEIVEARDDLLVLWDPNRLRSHPRLRSRAAVKIREIHGAYQILMQHGGRGEGATEREASADLSSTPAVASEAGPSADVSVQPVSGSASLFDEVFRDRKAEKRSRLPMGPILAGAVVALSAVLILLLIGGGDSPQEPDPTSLTVPAPLPPTPPEPAGPPRRIRCRNVRRLRSRQGRRIRLPPRPPQSPLPRPNGRSIRLPKHRLPLLPNPAVASPPKPEKPKPARPPRPDGRPVLVREPDGGKPAAAAAPRAPEPKTSEEAAEEKRQLEEAEKAYRDLVSGSKAAQRLVEGQVPSLRFTEWSIAGRRGSELLVDLIAEQFGGNPVHFVWGVDTATGMVRALSQAARDLELAVAEE